MTHAHSFPPALTRRHWLVLAGSALSGCGGGGDLLAGLPGTGGTGSPLFAQGTISGFGSVIINGIKFDDTLASVQMDGKTVGSDALRLGMVAGVRGERSAADTRLGIAAAIEVWSIAQGVVSRVAGSVFEVMGMSIQTDGNTSLEGVPATSGLTVGQTVTVWGLQSGDDGKQWAASRVAVLPDGTSLMVSTGFVQRAADAISLNDWQLSGAPAVVLKDGQLVRAQGTVGANSSFNLSGAKLLNSGFESNPQGTTEIEGVVTSKLSATRFMLGTITVDGSYAALATTLSQLVVGSRVEVNGNWSMGVLVASQISVENGQSLSVEIDATIEQFTSLANFVMRGQRCDASAATISNGTAVNVKAGVKVKVTGTKAGDLLRVASLEFRA